MNNPEYQYCSWCGEKTYHNLFKRNLLTRNDYVCENCGNFTVQCRYCKNMAKGKPRITQSEIIWKSIKENWNDELCGEHDGTIANFETLNIKLNDLEDYEQISKRVKKDLKKIGKIAGGIIGGAAVFAPLGIIAAPAFASFLGSAGLLGAASTGTAISTLSGAVLTNASLAALGFGAIIEGGLGMAGGVIFITAAGAALGGIKGGIISNNYFGAVEDFSIKKVNQGTGGPALIFINGFLSQKNQDSRDWREAVKNHFPTNPWYYVTWESKALYDIGSLIVKDASGLVFRKFAVELAKKATRKARSKLNPISWATIVADFFGNPWNSAMAKSSMTGFMLADLIARTRNNEGFILMGHSLGARVIYYLLNNLSTKEEKYIRDVYLLGGAVDRTDNEGWQKACNAVDGKIYNCYSKHDFVLKYLYQGATFLKSNPAGLGKISVPDPKIQNKDVSDIVKGHMLYKEHFGLILSRLQKKTPQKVPLIKVWVFKIINYFKILITRLKAFLCSLKLMRRT